jgi:hypothetical protein
MWSGIRNEPGELPECRFDISAILPPGSLFGTPITPRED